MTNETITLKKTFSAFFALMMAVASGIGASPAAQAKGLRVALVLDKGGKDDKSFNSAAYSGAMKAKSDLGAFVKYVEATDDNAFETLLRSFAQKDFDLIFAIGITQRDALKKVAAQFPQKRFAIVDAEVDLPNVRTLLFEEHQGSYVVGAAAAMASKSGVVGFIGGMDIPLIRRFQMGYEAGAKKINPKVKVVTNFIGISGDAWNNPAKAKELARHQIDAAADVIFSPSGASTSGVFDAVEEKDKLAIGVDSNQNWVKPGKILTSMLKRVDVAVFDTCKAASEGKFEPGIKRFGFGAGGVDYAADEHNARILDAGMRKRLDAIKADIVAGRIQVPDYYKKK